MDVGVRGGGGGNPNCLGPSNTIRQHLAESPFGFSDSLPPRRAPYESKRSKIIPMVVPGIQTNVAGRVFRI